MIKYDIVFLFDNEKRNIINKYKNEMDHVLIIINESEYLSYDFVLWFINEKIENNNYRENIINKLNNIIKISILNMDDSYLNKLNSEIKILQNKNTISFNNKFPIYKIKSLNEIKIHSSYFSKNKIIIYIKEYIKNNKHLLFTLNNELCNTAYFVKNFNIYDLNIKIYIKEKQIELSLENYLRNYKKIINIYGKENINIYIRLYYTICAVSLNNNKSDIFYEVLNLEKKELFESILEDNLYENIDIYVNNNIIKIKKFTLYQLLYFNKD